MAETIRIEIDDRELLRLIQATKGSPARVVADGVEYGIYQEYGTSRGVPPKRFMGRAAQAIRPGFEAAWKQARSYEQADRIVEKGARDVERKAKENAPVDTGALRASIHVVEGERFVVEFESER